MRIKIDEETLPRLGNASLIGKIDMSSGKLPEKVILEFPQSSSQWRERNKGPKEFIITEYNVPCLVNDILWLISQGVKVVVEEPVEM